MPYILNIDPNYENIDTIDPNCAKLVFTSKDIVEIYSELTEKNIQSTEELIKILDNKSKCNNLASLLRVLLKKIKLLTDRDENPDTDVLVLPITDTVEMIDGVATLTKTPVSVNNRYVLNNIVLLKLYEDKITKTFTGTYLMFDDPIVNPTNKSIRISEQLSGILTVTYYAAV